MNDAVDIRKYLHTRRESYVRPEVELPSWLPQNGLLYYDDLTEYRTRALTGQAYYRRESAGPDPNPPIVFVNLKGKSCMYKAEALNSVRIRLPHKAIYDGSMNYEGAVADATLPDLETDNGI